MDDSWWSIMSRYDLDHATRMQSRRDMDQLDHRRLLRRLRRIDREVADCMTPLNEDVIDWENQAKQIVQLLQVCLTKIGDIRAQQREVEEEGHARKGELLRAYDSKMEHKRQEREREDGDAREALQTVLDMQVLRGNEREDLQDSPFDRGQL